MLNSVKVKMTMIRYAKQKDKEELLALCLSSLPMKEKPYLEYYFDQMFKEGDALISEMDNKLISQIHLKEHVLTVKGKRLKVSYLFGIATHYDYRKRGIMRDLMEMIIDDCSCNHLLTFLEASNPRMFERFGFEVVSERKRYIVYAKELLKYNVQGVSETYQAKELSELYKAFAKHFDCYYERDEKYYQHYINMAKHKGSRICVYRDVNHQAKGYALFDELDDGIEIREIIYEDTKTLCRLLKYAIGYNPFISVEVSQAERLEKIFKLSVPRSYHSVMMRVNDTKLFNKLYNTNVKNAKDFIECLDKTVLINEKC